MPLPLWIGKVNKVGFNRISRLAAAYLPGFGVVIHHGRRTGREFRTPVNVFTVDGGYIVALIYGSKTDWLKNVIAAGGCQIKTRGRVVDCSDPVLYRDEERRHIRPFERYFLGLLNVSEFLRLTSAAP